MSMGVLLADDHPIFRQGLKNLLQAGGFKVVAECSDGYEALERAAEFRPGVAVLDLAMPRLNGLDTARRMQQVSPRTKTILLTVHHENQYVLEALRAGVKGYVLKLEAGTALVQAIREANRRNVYISPGAAGALVEACRSDANLPTDPLTPCEREVVRLIAKGLTTREVADHLGLPVKTTESYRIALMKKLDIHETANLVRYAVRCGLVDL